MRVPKHKSFPFFRRVKNSFVAQSAVIEKPKACCEVCGHKTRSLHMISFADIDGMICEDAIACQKDLIAKSGKVINNGN